MKLSLDDCRLQFPHYPSGDPTPSQPAIDMTKQIAAVARPLRIAVHDHIIVGKGGRHAEPERAEADLGRRHGEFAQALALDYFAKSPAEAEDAIRNFALVERRISEYEGRPETISEREPR